MRMRIEFLASAFVLAFGSVCTMAQPADPYNLRPGARGKVCEGCHADFEEKLEQAYVHSPVQADDCSACHNPHASDHGQLLATDTDRICGSCHEEVVPDGAVSVHEALAGGGCTNCHDPHASAQENQLVEVEAELCVLCHAEVGETAANSRFTHPPAADGCTTCHDPHASSTEASLLRSDQRSICGDCHDLEEARFSSAHRGYPVGEGRCTSCHAPHGSDETAMLWSNVHQPVASRSCELCHNDPSSPTPLATRKQGVDTCRGCHAEDVNQVLTARYMHWPVLEGKACLNCHDPHATKQTKLLSGAQAEICGDCHASTLARQAAGVSKHKPAEDGMCTSCHGPHASESSSLLVWDAGEACGNCHEWATHTAHPLGEEVRDPRNPNLAVDCRSCHRMHGAPFKYLTPFDHRKELCVQCHAELGR